MNKVKKYRFISDREPTNEELSEIMKEVAIDAKINSETNAQLLLESIKNQIQIARNNWEMFSKGVVSENS